MRQCLVYPLHWKTGARDLWTLEFCWGRNSRGSPVCLGPNQRRFHRGEFLHPLFQWKSSSQWLDVPRPFCETGVATAAWTEISTLTPGVLWITLLGSRMAILSTCGLSHAASVVISLMLMVLIGFKLFSNRSLRNVSWTLVTRSYQMTTGLILIGLIDIFWIPLVMWVSTLGFLIGSTCSLESLIVSTWSSDS